MASSRPAHGGSMATTCRKSSSGEIRVLPWEAPVGSYALIATHAGASHQRIPRSRPKQRPKGEQDALVRQQL